MSTNSTSLPFEMEFKTDDEMVALMEKVDREHADKKKELETFLKVCADGTGETLNRIAYIGRKDHTLYYKHPKDRRPLPTKEELEDLTSRILHKVVMGETVLKNGKGKGEWNNGDLGSRWWDWEEGDMECRIAFHSKKFFSGDWKYKESYALLLNFCRVE